MIVAVLLLCLLPCAALALLPNCWSRCSFAAANCNRTSEPSCGYSPIARLGSATTRLRCCPTGPQQPINVKWSWSEDGRTYYPIRPGETHNTELMIDSGSIVRNRDYFNGFYRCHLQFQDGLTTNFTQHLVFPMQTRHHNAAPIFRSCGRQVQIIAAQDTHLQCSLLISFERGAELNLKISMETNDAHPLAECRLVPYCLRLRRYLLAEKDQSRPFKLHSNHCSIARPSILREIAVVGVNDFLIIQLTIRANSAFDLRLTAQQPKPSPQKSSYRIKVALFPTAGLDPQWTALLALTALALLAGAIFGLAAFRRDLRLLSFRLRISQRPDSLRVVLLCSSSAGLHSVDLADQLRKELDHRFLLGGLPLAGTPTAILASAPGVFRDPATTVVVLLDGPSLRCELFVAQMKALLLSPNAWRVFVVMESFGTMRRTPELATDCQLLLDRLKIDAKHRDLVLWGPAGWRTRQVRLCLELRRWRLAELNVRGRRDNGQ